MTQNTLEPQIVRDLFWRDTSTTMKYVTNIPWQMLSKKLNSVRMVWTSSRDGPMKNLQWEKSHEQISIYKFNSIYN